MTENTQVISPEKLWTNYSLHNARKWLGLWTKWSPSTCEVIDCFDSIRHIELVDDMTKMKHQNTFIFSDGRVVDRGPMNGPWEYDRERNCDEEGLCHPSSRNTGKKARAFFFENGGGVSTVMEAVSGDIFFLEIFFPRGEIRFSTGVLFDKEGKATRMTLIREDCRARPSLYWSSDTNIRDAPSTSVPKTLTGTESTLTRGLLQTVQTDCQLDANHWQTRDKKEGNTVIYLPDDITISFPLQLYDAKSTSQDFHITTYWDVKETQEVRQQTVYYVDGKFSCFKQGIYQ